MNVRELVAMLTDEIDPETVVVVLDADELPCHVLGLDIEQFTVTLRAGEYVTEEDLS